MRLFKNVFCYYYSLTFLTVQNNSFAITWCLASSTALACSAPDLLAPDDEWLGADTYPTTSARPSPRVRHLLLV